MSVSRGCRGNYLMARAGVPAAADSGWLAQAQSTLLRASSAALMVMTAGVVVPQFGGRRGGDWEGPPASEEDLSLQFKVWPLKRTGGGGRRGAKGDPAAEGAIPGGVNLQEWPEADDRGVGGRRVPRGVGEEDVNGEEADGGVEAEGEDDPDAPAAGEGEAPRPRRARNDRAKFNTKVRVRDGMLYAKERGGSWDAQGLAGFPSPRPSPKKGQWWRLPWRQDGASAPQTRDAAPLTRRHST